MMITFGFERERVNIVDNYVEVTKIFLSVM